MRLLPRLLICALLLAPAAVSAAPGVTPADPLAKAAGPWSGTAEYAGGKFPVTLNIEVSGTLLRGTFRVMQGASPVTGAFEAAPAGGGRRVHVSVNVVPPLSLLLAASPSPEPGVLLVDSALGKGRAEFYGDYSRCVFMFTTITGKVYAVLARGARPSAAGKARGARRKKSGGSSMVPLKL